MRGLRAFHLAARPRQNGLFLLSPYDAPNFGYYRGSPRGPTPVLPPLTCPYITRHSVTTAAHFYCFPGGLWCTAQSAITKISIRAFSPGAGRFDIPILRPELTTAENWISFNYAKGCEEPSEHGVHFFVDDYQFNRIWAHPDNYLGMMARFDTVCTPDFSTYTDFPRIIQIYNHYRKHWLGAYWQAHGIKVIPTISWSTPDSFAWCFDGEPVGGAVAVSSVGTQASPESAALFMAGYNEMLRRLQPAQIIFYGYRGAESPDRASHFAEYVAEPHPGLPAQPSQVCAGTGPRG